MMKVEYLSPKQYAERFNINIKTVYHWCESGKLKTLPKPPRTRLVRIIVSEERPNVLVFPSEKK